MDGNGRTSRLVMNFILTSKGYPIINIQPDKASRDTYMETLAYTQRTGNIQPFVRLVIDYLNQELTSRIELLTNLAEQARLAKKQTRLDLPD